MAARKAPPHRESPDIVMEPEARGAYLAMGAVRSISGLERHFGERSVSARVLKTWASRNDWAKLADAYDERVTRNVISQAVVHQAKTRFDAIKALDEAAEIVLDTATLRIAAIAAAERGDARGMISAAVEALKLKEVLTGGVSDRTASVVDREKRAAELVERLEDAVRRRHGSTPTVDYDGTA